MTRSRTSKSRSSSTAALVGTVSPAGTAYSPFETSSFTVGAGTHLVQLVGVNPQGGNATDLIDAVSLTMADDEISDSGFETPILASNSYVTAPTGTSWQFTGSAGIAANNSSITTVTGNAPQGTQVGFITNNGTHQPDHLPRRRHLRSRLPGGPARQSGPATADPGLGRQHARRHDHAHTHQFHPPLCLHALPDAQLHGRGRRAYDHLHRHQSDQRPEHRLHRRRVPRRGEQYLQRREFRVAGPALPELLFDPTGSAWKFTGLAGISTNLSAFTNGSAYAPVGNQDAFLKNNASISQSVYFDAGTYNITFLATQRVGYQPQEFQVTVGSLLVGTFTPTLSSVTNNGIVSYTFAPYQTSNFTVAAGSYTVTSRA